jgi:hypothetical protein
LINARYSCFHGLCEIRISSSAEQPTKGSMRVREMKAQGFGAHGHRQGARHRPGERFGVNSVAIAVPKGHAGRLAYIREFIEEAKTSGLVQQAIENAGLRGVQVAPAAGSR